MYGYADKILTVNLSDGKVTKERIRDDLVENYIAGEGFGARLLWENLKPGVDPLSPENVLIFAPGLDAGSPFPPSGKLFLNYKSPLTGFYGQNGIGGDFAPFFKFAGYDVLIVEGKADKPVYIFIDDDKVEIRDATAMWGKLGWETDELIKDDIGDQRVKIIRIGPAGENLNRLSCITADYNRAAGRGGNGAVMGSKNLKAIAVRGTGRVSYKDEDKLKEVSKESYRLAKQVGESFGMLEHHLYPLSELYVNTLGIPVHHYQQAYWDKGAGHYAEEFAKLFTGEDDACWGCPCRASKVLSPRKDPYREHKVSAKIEADWAWGWNLMIEDLDELTEIFYQIAQNGVDINGSAEWAGWLAECQERGILTPGDCGGLEVRFGDAQSMLRMLHAIFRREGFGDVLAEGPKIAAEKVGKGSEKYVMHVKGAPLDAEEYRGEKGFLLGVATQERGACANRNWTFGCVHMGIIPEVCGVEGRIDPLAEKGIAKWFKPFRELYAGPLNTIGGCFLFAWFGVLTADDLVGAYRAMTGREISVEESMKIGERILNLSRAFNAREGFSREDDTMPERFLKEPVNGGPTDGARVENFDAMIDEFYNECGFDLKTGWPTPAKLGQLGLKDVADELYPRGRK